MSTLKRKLEDLLKSSTSDQCDWIVKTVIKHQKTQQQDYVDEKTRSLKQVSGLVITPSKLDEIITNLCYEREDQGLTRNTGDYRREQIRFLFENPRYGDFPEGFEDIDPSKIRKANTTGCRAYLNMFSSPFPESLVTVSYVFKHMDREEFADFEREAVMKYVSQNVVSFDEIRAFQSKKKKEDNIVDLTETVDTKRAPEIVPDSKPVSKRVSEPLDLTIKFAHEFDIVYEKLLEADVWRSKQKKCYKGCPCDRCNTKSNKRPQLYQECKKAVTEFIEKARDVPWKATVMVYHMLKRHKEGPRVPLYPKLLVLCNWTFVQVGSINEKGKKNMDQLSLFDKGDVQNRHGMDECTTSYTIEKLKKKNCSLRPVGLRGARRWPVYSTNVVNNWYKTNTLLNWPMSEPLFGLKPNYDIDDSTPRCKPYLDSKHWETWANASATLNMASC